MTMKLEKLGNAMVADGNLRVGFPGCAGVVEERVGSLTKSESSDVNGKQEPTAFKARGLVAGSSSANKIVLHRYVGSSFRSVGREAGLSWKRKAVTEPALNMRR